MSGSVSSSRLKNAKRNVISGAIKQGAGILLSFLVRTTLINVLGIEYQGLTGLFSAILQVLNFSDLGFSTAVMFILYKLIAEKDNEAICAIIAFLKKAYFVIGCVILGLGLLIMPFLPSLISGDYPDDVNIYILFSIYLCNAVISYWLFAYKGTLLSAMQREDLVSDAFMISSTCIRVLQLTLLHVFKNYYIYILILPIGGILNNVLLQVFSKKLFPQVVACGKIDSQVRVELKKQVKAVFLNRMSDVARNCFDDIVISAFWGLTAVTAYDNYYYVYTAVIGIMSIIAHSVRASIGNSIVKETIEKNYRDLNKFTFMFMWVTGWFSISLLVLYQPFMSIWMNGKPQVLLSNASMSLFCLYFYFFCMTHTKSVYLEARGLFWKCRYLYILEAFVNLGLNVLLGYFCGITGVLIATIGTIFFFNFIGGSLVLFRNYFKRTPKEFYLLHAKCFIATMINAAITYSICSLIPSYQMKGFFTKIMICMVLPNLFFLLFYFKSKNFADSFKIIKQLVKKKS